MPPNPLWTKYQNLETGSVLLISPLGSRLQYGSIGHCSGSQQLDPKMSLPSLPPTRSREYFLRPDLPQHLGCPVLHVNVPADDSGPDGGPVLMCYDHGFSSLSGTYNFFRPLFWVTVIKRHLEKDSWTWGCLRKSRLNGFTWQSRLSLKLGPMPTVSTHFL